MNPLSKEAFDKLAALVGENPAEAARLLTEYERTHKSDRNLCLNIGGFLIDIGSALKDGKQIDRGIRKIEKLRSKNRVVLTSSQLYNLGNGYYAAEAVKRGTGYKYDAANTPMVRAKQCYREALRNADPMSADLQAQLHTNYANSLAELGRSVEAISELNKALQIAPNHPMALGNLGKQLQTFAQISRDVGLLDDALEAVNRALSGDRLEISGNNQARVGFERVKQRMEKQLKDTRRPDSREHRKPEIIDDYHSEFVRFCGEHELFLNFCLAGRTCSHPYEDRIGFKLTTQDDDTGIHRIARIINEIKERYALARLLLFEACQTPYRVEFYEELTPYINIVDGSTYGVRPAKFKMAFEAAYNILDKIGFFVNEYLRLGVHPTAAGFLNIWKSKPSDNSLRTEMSECDNIHLYGLYDVARDFSKDSYFIPLKQLRDNLTHSYVVVHLSKDGEWHVASDGETYHIGYEELRDRTIRLMQIVRAAVIYLIAFIEQEERKKAKGASTAVTS